MPAAAKTISNAANAIETRTSAPKFVLEDHGIAIADIWAGVVETII